MTRPQSGHAKKNACSSSGFDGATDWTSRDLALAENRIETPFQQYCEIKAAEDDS
jgi:hypothetical protein